MAPSIRAIPRRIGSRRELSRQAGQHAALLPRRGGRLCPHVCQRYSGRQKGVREGTGTVRRLFQGSAERNFRTSAVQPPSATSRRDGRGVYHDPLYLAATCNYGDLEQEMIRDRLVVGIRDSALSETLQTDAKLTLEAAKTKIRQREAVHEQQRELKGAQGGKPGNLDNLQSRRRTNYSDRRRESNHPRETGEGRPRDKQCTRCGKGQHPREKCQARDATCYKCQRKGHYSSQCRSKTVAPVTVEGQSNLESTFLDAASTPKGTAWFADIQLSDQETLTFKLDTGAEVTAISDSCYQSLSHQPPLNTPDKVLLWSFPQTPTSERSMLLLPFLQWKK